MGWGMGGMCACESKRGAEREGEREKEREVRVCVCACVCVYTFQHSNNNYLVHCFIIMYLFKIIVMSLCFITVILCTILQVLVLY